MNLDQLLYPEYGETPKCPVLRSTHDHDLIEVRRIHNPEGHTAVIWECPSGNYRWFQIVDPFTPFSDNTRTKRPRWGWKD